MEYIIELLSDPGFMGALLGSIITGVIAISVFIFQVIHTNKLQERESNKLFIKAVKTFRTHIFHAQEQIIEIINTPGNVKDFIYSLNKHVEETILNLNSIEDIWVSDKVFDNYLNVKEAIDVISFELKSLLEENNYLSNSIE